MTNGVEYSLDLHPMIPGTGPTPSVTLLETAPGSGAWNFAVTYRRPAGHRRPVDVNYTVERATDSLAPEAWSTDGLAPETVSPTADPRYETVTVRSLVPYSSLSREFIRLKVNLNAQ